MNLEEREMVFRVYKALEGVPGTRIGGGRLGTTVGGVASFPASLQTARQYCTDTSPGGDLHRRKSGRTVDHALVRE